MSKETTRKALYKHPAIIIFTFFIAGFFLLQHYSRQLLSDAPLVLTNANPPEIYIYSTRNCPYCYLAKEFFNKHQLTYTEYDIENSNKHLQMFYLLGGKATPLLIINNQTIHGFDENLIRDAL